MTTIKQELGANPQIKTEASLDAPAQHIKPESTSDDEYEDAGDLDLMHGKRGLWLVKLPKFVLENWEKLDDDEEITLGTIFVSPDERFRFVLNPDLPCHEELPQKYDMLLNNRNVTNTWVFTEKDMPGFAKPKQEQQDPNMPAIPSRLLYERDKTRGGNAPDRRGGTSWNKGQRREPYIRKAIPKKTAIVGTVVHEATIMTPEDDPKYKKLMLEAQLKAMKPTHGGIQLFTGPTGGNLLAPGTVGQATGNFDSFIRRTEPLKKPQENKAARMEKHALLDALFGCFKEFTAWSIKGLRERLQQPEAYLKVVLGEIAVLHKSGKFALKYTLKPEYVQQNPEDVAKALEAGGGAAGGGSGGLAGTGTGTGAVQGGAPAAETIEIDDDEDEEEMEDVL